MCGPAKSKPKSVFLLVLLPRPNLTLMKLHHPFTKAQWLTGILVILTIIIGIAFLANHLVSDHLNEALLLQFGYVGIIIIGVIAGLNTFVPIPAASFTPLFLEAGFTFPFIILFLSIGTIIADIVGYIFGQWSREFFLARHPRFFAYFTRLATKHTAYISTVLFLYAAFVPFPNELMIIPLAFGGVRFRTMVVPLFIGNMLNHTMIALGVVNLTSSLF
jgi:membrane protein YqaA with SNARE-associated domain